MPKSAILGLPAAGEQDVSPAEVRWAMPSRSAVVEPREDAFDEPDDLRQVERPDDRAQRTPGDVLHRDVRHAVVLEEVEQRDDVRVAEGAASRASCTKRWASRDSLGLEVEPS
jgi:hypothetical protein